MLPVLILLVLELNLELRGRLLLKPLKAGAFAPAEREAEVGNRETKSDANAETEKVEAIRIRPRK